MNQRLYDALETFLRGTMNLAEVEGIDRLIELDLSMSQARILHVLAYCGGPMPIHALADRLRLSVAATGRNVDRLVQDGLVERREDSTDRRVKQVSLLEAGIAAVDQHVEAKRAAVRTLIDRLSTEQADQLLAALEPIVASDILRRPNQEHCT